MSQQEEYLSGIRHRLAEAEGEIAHTRSVEVKIAESATARLSEVESELGRIRGEVSGDAHQGERYQQLMMEAGRLREVIARARRAP
jgi:hypothetical protein